MNAVPDDFAEFLELLRIRTEAAWAILDEPSLPEFELLETSETHWKPGTQWLQDFSDSEIDALEQHYDLKFPNDYRMFLQKLHAPDRPMYSVDFGENDRPVEGECPSFYNWRASSEVPKALEWLMETLVFDFLYGNFWLEDWGARPKDEQDARDKLQILLANAPKLIPVIGHRYLVPADVPQGYLVISMYGSDTIYYADSLRSILVGELGGFLFGETIPEQQNDKKQHKAMFEIAKRIPFWGQIIS
jgi:hypothetical protein